MSEASDQNPTKTTDVVPDETAPAPAAAETTSAPAEAEANTAPKEEKPKAVFVENLSPSVTTKMLNEFFSLCGPIESITVRPKPNAEDGTLEAIVFFETSGAADTAVLLTNAILVDRVISISYFKGASAKEFNTEGAADSKAAPAGEASGEAPSVWAQILAAGYRIGDNIQNAAIQVDQKYGIVKGFEDTVDKIDTTLGISTKAAAFSETMHQKSEEYHVSEKIDAMNASLAQAGEQISRTANNVYEATMQNQYVSSALSTLAGWGSALASGWAAMTEEANAIYAQQTGKTAETTTSDNSAATAAAATAETSDPDSISVPKDASEPQEKPAEASSDEVKIPTTSTTEGDAK